MTTGAQNLGHPLIEESPEVLMRKGTKNVLQVGDDLMRAQIVDSTSEARGMMKNEVLHALKMNGTGIIRIIKKIVDPMNGG